LRNAVLGQTHPDDKHCYFFENNLEFFSTVTSNWKFQGNIFYRLVVRMINGSDIRGSILFFKKTLI